MKHNIDGKKIIFFAVSIMIILFFLIFYGMTSRSYDVNEKKQTNKASTVKITKKASKPKDSKKLKKLHYASTCVYVYNLTNDKVVYDRNSGKRMPITSLVKLMNCRKALQLMSKKNIKLKSNVKLIKKAVKLTRKQGEVESNYYLNEKLRYKDLIYAMMLRSDADSAKTIAIKLRGNLKKYVKEMNAEAKKLGLKDTKYVNVDGAKKKGQYSTGRDVVKLLKISMKNKKFYKTITTEHYRSKRTYQHPYGVVCSNTTVRRFKPYNNGKFKVIGGKYGYSGAVGRTVVVIAKKHKKTYLIVVMGNKHKKDRDRCTDESVRDVLKVMRNL